MGLFGRLFGGAKAKLAERKAQSAPIIEAGFAKVRAGLTVTPEELESARAAFAALHEALSAVYGTEDNRRFNDKDRADFYVQALKLAALEHPDHDAWPVMADLRRTLLGPLRAKMGSTPGGQEDPWLNVCAIQPSLLEGNVPLAKTCFARLEGEPVLARLSLAWANDAVIGFTEYNEQGPVNEFLAGVPQRDPWNMKGHPLTDEERRPLLASIYPSIARDPRTALADARNAAAVRIQLERDWEVTSPELARSCLAWLSEEGHRAQLQEELESGEASTEARARFVGEHLRELKDHFILAWDLGRLISVARASHKAGYLTEDEAWIAVLDAGERLAAEYDSWDDFGDDFVLGNGFFDPDSAGEERPHTATVRWLQRDARSPWRRVAFR